MASHLSYAERKREARKLKAEEAQESHERSPTIRLSRPSQYNSNVRHGKLQQHRSVQRSAIVARTEPTYRKPSKNFYQSPTNNNSSSIPEGQMRHVNKSSAASIENLMYSASEGKLLEHSPPELIKALLSLRNENSNLKHTQIPQRVSSLCRGTDKKLPVPTPQCVEQQEAALALVCGELTRVQTEFEQEKTKVAELEKKFEQEKKKASESERQRKRAIKELAQLSTTHTNPFDDQHFKEQVELLQHKVDHWVRNQDWNISTEEYFSTKKAPEEFVFLSTTSPYYLEYMTSPRGMERLVEAYIWQFAMQKIFGQSIWALSLKVHNSQDHEPVRSRNEFSALYFDLQQSVPDRQELFHNWRVASARALAAREPQTIDLRARDIAIRDLGRELENELDGIMFTHLDYLSLAYLLEEMVDLDFEFAQQKPYYAFYTDADMFSKTLGVPFSSTSMRVSMDDSTKIVLGTQQSVKLILRPGLLKSGNSAGKNYHQYASLIQMTVEIAPVGQHRYEQGLNRVNSYDF